LGWEKEISGLDGESSIGALSEKPDPGKRKKREPQTQINKERA